MTNSELHALARRMVGMEKAIRDLKTPQLANSTIENGQLKATTAYDQVTMTVGRQFDGTNTAAVLVGPKPPTPTVPLVTSELNTLRVYWDGTFEDGASIPLDFTRVTIHAVPIDVFGVTGVDPLDQAHIVGEINTATGGEITASLSSLEYAVYLLAWTQAGKFSEPSQVAIGTPGDITAIQIPGKNAVLWSPTPPSTENRVEGDTWFDTDDGNKIHRLLDGAWVPTQFGTPALESSIVSDISSAQTDSRAALNDAADAQSAADAAGAAATAAATAAANAAGLANSKGKVLIQSAAPAAADQLTQNLWIDTTGGANTPKRWSGTAWVAVTDKASTDAAAAAAAAQTTATNAASAASTADGKAVAATTAASNAASAATAAQTTATNAASAASTAQAAANAAAADAASAAGLAGSKGKVLIQSAAPAAADQLAQNLWIDTTGGANTPKRWSGTAWVAVTDKASTDAAAAAAAAQTTATNAASAASAAQTSATNAASAASAAQTTATNAASAASAAQAAANAAAADAASAAGVAGSKGKVLIQSAAPAAADQLAQNLWIDTTGGANTPKRWSGTAWVAVTDKAATDAASAAVAAQGTANNAASAAATADGKAVAAQLTASNALTAAATADGKAVAAQATANGKNKVVFSSSSPTAASAGIPGDVWFVQSGTPAQVTGQYLCTVGTGAATGNTWVIQQLTNSVIATLDAAKITTGFLSASRLAAGTIAAGSAIIADGAITNAQIASAAITNAKIADATIQAAKIQSVDAGTITTGYLAAGRIAADTITTGMIAAAGIDAAVIKFGTMSGERIEAGTITADQIDSEYVYTGSLQADQIESGSIQASLGIFGSLSTKSETTGRSVQISGDSGLQLLDVDGVTKRVDFPTDPTQNIRIEGDVVARSLRATGGVSLGSASNELTPSSALILRSGSTAPATPPSITQFYPETAWDSDPLTGRTRSIQASGGYLYQFDDAGNMSLILYTRRARVSRRNLTTMQLEEVILEITQRGPGLALLAGCIESGNIHLLVADYSRTKGADNNPRYFVRKYTMAGAYVSEWECYAANSNTGSNLPTMGPGRTAGTLLFARVNGANTINITELNTSTGTATDLSSNFTAAGISAGQALSSINYATTGAAATEMGGTHFIVSTRDRSDGDLILAFAGGARQPNTEWPAAYGDKVSALTYDTAAGEWIHKSGTRSVSYRYRGEYWLGGSTASRIAAGTWRDSDSGGTGLHETSLGAQAPYALKKRASVRVTLGDIPTSTDPGDHDDPDSIGVYASSGGTARTSFWRQAAPAAGVTTIEWHKGVYANTGGLYPNPPLAGNFPSSSPAAIRAENPSYYFSGAGSARFADLGADTLSIAGRDWVQQGAFCDIYRVTSAQAIPNATETALLFNTTLTGGPAASYAFSTPGGSGITCNFDGPVIILAKGGMVASATGSRILVLRKNGSEVWRLTVPASDTQPTFTIPEYAVPGDLYALGIYQSSGGSLNTAIGAADGPRLRIMRLG